MVIWKISLWLYWSSNKPNSSVTQKQHNQICLFKMRVPLLFCRELCRNLWMCPHLLMWTSFWMDHSCSHSSLFSSSGKCSWAPGSRVVLTALLCHLIMATDSSETCPGSWCELLASQILRWDLIAQPTVYSRSMKNKKEGYDKDECFKAINLCVCGRGWGVLGVVIIATVKCPCPSLKESIRAEPAGTFHFYENY